MDDVPLVRYFQRASNLQCDGERVLYRDRSAGHPLLEGFSIN